jgi:hypothetical protein
MSYKIIYPKVDKNIIWFKVKPNTRNPGYRNSGSLLFHKIAYKIQLYFFENSITYLLILQIVFPKSGNRQRLGLLKNLTVRYWYLLTSTHKTIDRTYCISEVSFLSQSLQAHEPEQDHVRA